ncbi:hypothetical protein Salat_2411200 [Sesamum alatum]|uniref:Uncharacterized protein n=1 Tax=Sesamum alatum TaxID=300844 RepID=A0AAE1XYU5_9LAMI|nr:hypothetical protein Salat_2411200 [Sesamum alatum]
MTIDSQGPIFYSPTHLPYTSTPPRPSDKEKGGWWREWSVKPFPDGIGNGRGSYRGGDGKGASRRRKEESGEEMGKDRLGSMGNPINTSCKWVGYRNGGEGKYSDLRLFSIKGGSNFYRTKEKGGWWREWSVKPFLDGIGNGRGSYRGGEGRGTSRRRKEEFREEMGKDRLGLRGNPINTLGKRVGFRTGSEENGPSYLSGLSNQSGVGLV